MPSFLRCDATSLPFADDRFDLVFGSPPYCDARTYGIGVKMSCQAWVDWMLIVTREAVRVSKGLVIWVCAGVTRDFCYWPACEGLLYEWWKGGGMCWRPAYWKRVGIAGSGGKQWLRADVEYCLCFSKEKVIPWSNNTACGHPPLWAPGGKMSHRLTSGERVNQWDAKGEGEGERAKNGGRSRKGRPSHVKTVRRCTRGKKGGDTIQSNSYIPPVLANPGNLIRVKVGGGLMGSKLCHENEAPFPEALAEFFLLSWCPPGGIVLDPFSGSGTTAATAAAHGRRGVGGDIRLSQCQLGRRRCAEVQTKMF